MKKRRIILIVEDDTDLRRYFRMALSLEGFEVLEAGDGLAALRLIGERPPDLVVLDLGLPRVSGTTVRQEIAAHVVTRHIPIVIVTGWREELSNLDVACVLRKPVSADQLVRTVHRCMASASPPVSSSAS